MELLEDRPKLDFEDAGWPIWTQQSHAAPAIFTGRGVALRSIVAGGCCVAGTVERSVVSQSCVIGSGSVVESTVVLPGVTIGRDCRIRNAIVAPGCTIPDGTELGGDAHGDAESCRCSTKGIAVITAEAVQRAHARSAPSKVA
jgi:glucose-1-phosphate adenylyltransferase